MTDANPPRKMARRVLAAWAIMVAMAGPLLSGYHFLASHGRLPEDTNHAAVLTILANISIVTSGVFFVGGVSSVFFVLIAGREDRLWTTIVKAMIVALVGWAFAAGNDKYMRITGAVLLVAVVCLLTPLGKWIERRPDKAFGGCMIAFIATLLFRSDWVQDLWTAYSGQKDFRLIPLSEMSAGNWFLALFGAAVYVLAFVEFQQWRTDGKWLRETKDRLRGDA